MLYARVFGKLFKKENMIESSKDKNPGTANAFIHGGFACGTLTLLCDVLKGFLPVFLYTRTGVFPAGAALVLAAPVVGHAFPIFYKFRGGKGIAVTFGCLFGLLPNWKPFAVLALFFIFFSVILKISPHFHRTLCAYLCAILGMACLTGHKEALLGFIIITAAVFTRMLLSKEEKEKMKVKLLWMR